MNLGKKGLQKEIKKSATNQQKKKSRSILRVVSTVSICFLLVICLGAAIGFGMIKGIIDDAPKITIQDVIPDEQLSMIYDANGELMETLVQAGSNRINVKEFESIPDDLVNAFVAIEDSRFWEHNGIDIKGIIRAAVKGVSSGFRFSEGASTITQQLIKNSIFTDWLSESSLGDRIERKIQEQYLALQLEKTVNDKEKILLSYLNTINLGNNCLGIAQASKRYFGKDYTELTLSECAVVAAITNNPSLYNPITHPDKNLERVEKILNDMEEQGYITDQQEEEALTDDVYTRIQTHNETYTASKNAPTNYFVDAVIEQAAEDLQEKRGYTQEQATKMLYSGGLRIYTTMDPAIQKIIDEEVNNLSNYPRELIRYSCSFTLKVTHKDETSEVFNEYQLYDYFREKTPTFYLVADSKEKLMEYIEEFADSRTDSEKGDTWELTSINYTLQPQVSFVLMDQHTGQVLGISGGRGEKTASLSLNRATNTIRQPGSLFKVLAGFTPALDACNDTLSSVYYDGPYSVGEKNFSNYWGSAYMGYSTIRQSIACSMNIVSVKCLNETVTPALAFDYLQNYGFTTLVESRTDSKGRVYSDINPSLSLGGLTDGVSNLETTAAYAAIANNGVYTKPIFYTKIEDSEGNVIIDNEPETHTVMKETTAYLLTSAMESTMDGRRLPTSPDTTYVGGTGRRADVPNMSIAGKTGTTTGTYDIWFAGFSPYYTATVWSGYDKMQTIEGYESVSYHKTIWKNIMTRVHASLDDIGFKAPAGIVSRQVCSKSGKLAVKGVCDHDPRGSMAYTEYYAEGTEPKEVCDKHVQVSVCTTSKLIATDNCPEKEEAVYMVLGSDATGDSDDSRYALAKNTVCTVDHVAESLSIEESILQSSIDESIKESMENTPSEGAPENTGVEVPDANATTSQEHPAEADGDTHNEHPVHVE